MTARIRRRTPAPADALLPRDEHAERAAIGAVLYGADDDSLDPLLIYCDGRRALLLAALMLRAGNIGEWPAQSSDHPRDAIAAAVARAERVGLAVMQAGTWPAHDGVEHELQQCLDVAPTATESIRYYVARLLDAWRRRETIVAASRLRAAALDPAADLADVIAGIDVTTLGSGMPRRRAADLLSLADVLPTPIRWLWPGRIARGKLTLVAGQPGLGKSLLTVDIAARVSRGCAWPDASPGDPAADVIMLSAEDDPADTIRPRLDAAGADVRRIAMLQSAQSVDPETGERRHRTVSLSDLATIRDALRQRPHCRLLVIDPITAYIAGVDSHRNSDVRALLAPLSDLATAHDLAIVAVTHLSKGGGDASRSAVERVNGSLAFSAAARAVWVIGRDPDRTDRRIMAAAKNNLGPDASGLAYAISPTPDGVPVLAWEADPVSTSADDLLAPPERDADSRGSAIPDAIEWLAEELSTGPVATAELQRRARAAGHSWSGAVRRAKDHLGVISRKDGMGGSWSWLLPEQGAHTQDP